MQDAKYYLVSLSTAEAVADTAQDSSDTPATASAAATVLPASAVLLVCSFPQHQHSASESTANEVQLIVRTHMPNGTNQL